MPNKCHKYILFILCLRVFSARYIKDIPHHQQDCFHNLRNPCWSIVSLSLLFLICFCFCDLALMLFISDWGPGSLMTILRFIRSFSCFLFSIEETIVALPDFCPRVIVFYTTLIIESIGVASAWYTSTCVALIF